MNDERLRTPAFTINGRPIGNHLPVYIIAEMSANHRRSLDEAIRLIKAANEAGADAVKLQTYTPDSMTIPSDKDYFKISGGTLWDGKTLFELYGEACTPWEWYPKLKEVAGSLGMDIFSTAFDSASVDFLESMAAPVHKIASFEIVDIPLIRKVARTGKPLIISTGMATLAEIEEAVAVARCAGAIEIALLKCTSSYPATPEEMNLWTIPHLASTFHAAVGLSDHTLGIAVPVAAVALGACIVEKHFTLSRSVPGPDSAFSLEPHEFKEMVKAIRVAEKSIGSVQYGTSKREAGNRIFRRSLFVVEDVKAGELLTRENVRCIRPGHGLHPRNLDEVLGRPAIHTIERGTPLSWDMVGTRNATGNREFSFSGRLRGPSVYLRPISREDADTVLTWRADPSVSSQLFSARPPTRAEHEAWFTALQGRRDCREFMVVLSQSDRPVGTVSLRRIEQKEAELGVMIGDHDYRGRGMAREACDLVIGYGFGSLGLRRVTLALFADNKSALKLYQRLGFREYPTHREQLKDGALRRTISMYLDLEDWEQRKPI